MKNLTKNQWLLIGGTVALAYILYSKDKKKGSKMIKEALSNDEKDYKSPPIYKANQNVEKY
tara:strand:+ start:147 stop:329 length:183 start_codon:yes stop_codon:yes gene_type:complete